jgi:hypothetical protein
MTLHVIVQEITSVFGLIHPLENPIAFPHTPVIFS